MNRRSKNYYSSAAILLLSVATPAVAQQVDSQSSQSTVGEVIVTANRREQNIQNVGAAVSQLSSETIRASGALDSKDLAQMIPGVYVASAFGGQSQQYTIRGVTQADYNDNVENPVAFYIDDVYITSSQGQTASILDIDRVEVLKGPQGTLFGRNATGGLVHFVVAKPKLDQNSGYGDLTYARFNDVNAQGAVNIPIGQKVAMRASVLYSQIDDYWKNRFPDGGPGSNPILSFDGPGGNTVGAAPSPRGQDLGGDKTIAARLQLLAEPTDRLSIRLTGSYSQSAMSTGANTSEPTIAVIDAQGRVVNEERVGPNETRLAIGPGGANYTGPAVITAVANGLLKRPAPGGDFFGYVPLDPRTLQLSEDYALSNGDFVSSQVYAAHVDYNLGGAQLSSTTSLQKYYKDAYVGDGSPANSLGFGNNSHTHAWSEELRLHGDTGKLKWQVGGFYLDNRVGIQQATIAVRGSALANLNTVFTGNPTAVENTTDVSIKSDFASKSLSTFGQFEYEFLDKWNLIAGARYIHENQEYHYRQFFGAGSDYSVKNLIVLSPAYQPNFDNKRSFDLWAGKLELEYRPTEGLLVYGGVNRGVKSGNYNQPYSFSPSDVIPNSQMEYQPETLISYEGGFKYGRRSGWYINPSVFYYDYMNYQAYEFVTSSGIVKNAKASVYGIDLESGVHPADGLRITFNYAYSHAEVKSFEISPGIFRNVQPAYSPRTQATVAIDYAFPRDVLHGSVSFNATANYTGDFYNNIRNFDAQKFAGRTLVNMSATWRPAGDKLYLTVFGKNILDKRYEQQAFDNTVVYGAQIVSFGKPASYGVTVGYKF